MTELEIILTIILWVVYGTFSAFQGETEDPSGKHEQAGTYITMIIFAPLVLAIRILAGIFSPRIFRD